MRYVSPRTRKRSPNRSISLKNTAKRKNTMKKRKRKGTMKKRKRKGTMKKRQSGGSGFIGALRTAVLPLLFYKAQKKQQKRVIKKKTKKRKLRR